MQPQNSALDEFEQLELECATKLPVQKRSVREQAPVNKTRIGSGIETYGQ